MVIMNISVSGREQKTDTPCTSCNDNNTLVWPGVRCGWVVFIGVRVHSTVET